MFTRTRETHSISFFPSCFCPPNAIFAPQCQAQDHSDSRVPSFQFMPTVNWTVHQWKSTRTRISHRAQWRCWKVSWASFSARPSANVWVEISDPLPFIERQTEKEMRELWDLIETEHDSTMCIGGSHTQVILPLFSTSGFLIPRIMHFRGSCSISTKCLFSEKEIFAGSFDYKL